MSIRTEREVEYLKVDTQENGCSIAVKSKHAANLMEFFRRKAVPFDPIFQSVGDEDILEMAAAEASAARTALEEWKGQYVLIEGQKNELARLKGRLILETDADKKRILRKQIRRLSFALKGKIRPADYFSTSELKNLDNLLVADEAIPDPDE